MNLAERSYEYSVRIAELVRFFREDGNSFPLSDELLGCGVEAGMQLQKRGEENSNSAIAALEKIKYLISMAVNAGYLTKLQSEQILFETDELLTNLKLGKQPPRQKNAVRRTKKKTEGE